MKRDAVLANIPFFLFGIPFELEFHLEKIPARDLLRNRGRRAAGFIGEHRRPEWTYKETRQAIPFF